MYTVYVGVHINALPTPICIGIYKNMSVYMMKTIIFKYVYVLVCMYVHIYRASSSEFERVLACLCVTPSNSPNLAQSRPNMQEFAFSEKNWQELARTRKNSL